MHLLGLLDFTNFITTAGYGAIFILSVLQSCCVPASSELTLGLAGALAAEGKLSLPGVIVAGVSGEVVGAYIAWVIGRYAGRAVVDRYGRYLLLSHRDLDRAEAWYDRHQRFGVFGSRLIPVIRNFVALPAGIAEVPLVRFGVLTAAGSLLWDGAWAGIGYAVGDHWHAIASGFSDIGYVLFVVAVGVIAFGLYHRYRSYKAATSGEQLGRPATATATSGPRHLRGFRTDVLEVLDGPSRPSRREDNAAHAGKVRWLASSSGRPPADHDASTRDRWVGGSSGRPVAHPRSRDFPKSPIAALEAVVERGRIETADRPRPLLDAGDAGVESNGRLTAMLGAVLFVLLAVEGVTILRVSTLLTIHVVIGMVLVPVVVLKTGSATWRFARYYLGAPAYRRKGPPPMVLRLLGPFVVATTIAVVGSGIALLLAPTSFRTQLLLIHKVTFFMWLAAMVIHVLGHLLDVAHLAPRDFYWRTRRQVRGAGLRQWAIVTAVCAGILLAVAVAPKVGPWLAGGHPAPKTVVTPSGSSNRHP